PLVTAGSGLALGLGGQWRRDADHSDATALPSIAGGELILSGSCSSTTRTQIDHACRAYPSIGLDIYALAEAFDATIESVLATCRESLGDTPVVVYAGNSPDAVAEAQEKLGRDAAGALIERAMGRLARTLVGDN